MKIEAKNRLDNYCVAVRNTLCEEKLENVFAAGNKEKAVRDALDRVGQRDEFEAIDAVDTSMAMESELPPLKAHSKQLKRQRRGSPEARGSCMASISNRQGRQCRRKKKKRRGETVENERVKSRKKGRDEGVVPGRESQEVVEEEGQQDEVKVVEDVMDWVTVKRRTKRRTVEEKRDEEGRKTPKVVQIFVKVDGAMTFPMDVSPSDKVSDVVRRIPQRAL